MAESKSSQFPFQFNHHSEKSIELTFISFDMLLFRRTLTLPRTADDGMTNIARPGARPLCE